MKRFFLVFFLIILSHVALADGSYQMALGFFPLGRLIKKTAENNQTSLTGDFYIGFTNANKNSYGIILSAQHEEAEQKGYSNPSDNQKIIRDRTSLGVAFGHSFESFYLRLGFYAYSRWVDTFDTVVTTYKDGLGVQFDFGVPIMMGSSFYFAPQFTIQTFQYRSSESSGDISTLNPPMTDTVFSPYLVFGFMI